MRNNEITAWPHQMEAFKEMSKVFDFNFSKNGKSGILVLPTGAGKTYTSINWIVRNVLDKGMKVLWLAQSFHLIDQAFDEFNKQLEVCLDKNQSYRVKKISGNKDDFKIHDLELEDRILVVTVQTAINSYNKNHTSHETDGNVYITNLMKWIDDSKKSGVFIVLDEAHHAPANGCRELITGIMDEIKGKCYLLGLTATPTYHDKKKIGWLSKLFKDGSHQGNEGIIYQADFNSLLAKEILAKPLIIQSNTDFEVEVDDKEYKRIVEEHKGIPENIISKLAQTQTRNDFIVDTYIRNRDKFKKTIIFADRWPQCVYIHEKLQKKGIKSGYVFSKTEAILHTADEINKFLKPDNKKTIEEYKNGKIDVIVNVRMLTEGTDVPDTKTVFITRQTTSQIMLTQMIGRALRGPKAGGGVDKKEANIIMFIDKWKQIINWAHWSLIAGGTSTTSITQKERLIELVSIIQLKKAINDFSDSEFRDVKPYINTIPVGWYVTQYSVGRFEQGLEQTEPVTDLVLVFDGQQNKYLKLIKAMKGLDPVWGKEFQNLEEMESRAINYMSTFFNLETDNIGNKLVKNVISIARHIGTNGIEPKYYDFTDHRDKHDIDKLANYIIKLNLKLTDKLEYLKNEYNSTDKLWKIHFNNNYYLFVDQVDKAILRKICIEEDKNDNEDKINIEIRENTILDDETKRKVKERDSNTCLACGASGKGVRIQIDHILPKFQGGDNKVENLQCLCSKCNSLKTKNAIDFRIRQTKLEKPQFLKWMSKGEEDDYLRVLKRSINFFYCANAVQEIEKVKTDKSEFQIKVVLHKGNDLKWIRRHSSEILKKLKSDYGSKIKYIKEITFKI